MRLCFVTLCTLCALDLGAQRDFPVQTKTPRAPDVERILARTDARKDTWIGEQDYEALNGWIQKNKAMLPWPAGTVDRFGRLTLTELKVIASNRSSDREQATTLRLRVELGGTAHDGKRLSLLGHATATFEKRGGEWALQAFVPEALREVTAAQGSPRFTDITERALSHNTSFRHQLARSLDAWRAELDEATGIDVYGHNGIAVGDYNGDGLEDLYVCQPSGLPNRLYRNNGDGTLDDVSAAAGVDVLDGSTMALFGDVDNDGDQDLIVVAGARVLLFVNDGRGRYAAHPNPGFALSGATLTSAALADFDRDGHLDLYVCAYDFWSPGATYDAPTPYYDATNGPPNFLYRNRGDGSFEDVTASGMGQNNNRFSFAASWADYDKDGWPDLYVANDFGRNNLYRNNGDGTFADVAAQAGVEDLAAGMSVSWGDHDGDGWLDLYVSNMWSSAGQRLTFNPAFADVAADQQVRAAFQRQARGNSLFRNNGDGTFSDVTLHAGVEFGRWAWASAFFDYDNDGRLDVFVTNGYMTGPDTHDL